MSLVTVKYDILVSGIYPTKGKFEKNGFKLLTNIVDNEKINSIFDMGVLYLSPYLGFCCYNNENENPIYLTLNKEISFDIDYGETEEYNREFTTEYLQSKNLFDEINDLEKLMTLEINNYIKFPIKIIKVFNHQGSMISMIGDIEKINVPSLMSTDIDSITEIMKRQKNRLGNSFSYESISELKKNNMYFANALDVYFSSFSVSDEKVGFVLLVTALESLLNLSTYSKPKKCSQCSQPVYAITDTVSQNVGLILMNQDESFIKEIRSLYGKRSKYIHNGKQDITKKDEQNMQEYVRKVLLMYWVISLTNKTFKHKEIIKYMQSSEYQNNLSCKTFLTALNNVSYNEIETEVLKQIFHKILKGTLYLGNS